MTDSGKLQFGVDLVTFFHPEFWAAKDHDSIVKFAQAEPDQFWNKMLDGIAGAGVTGIELTFPPFNWQGAVETFGSIDGFGKAMAARGLTLASGFFVDLERHGDIADPAAQQAVIDAAARYAEVIAACGGHALVSGVPMRRSRDAEPPLFVDLARAQGIADVLNRIGAATARHGVTLALHTESHSMLSTARDVDLFMLLTDPVYVGFCPDAAHLFASGADPVAVTARHIDRVVIAHWKDAVGRMPPDMPIDEQIHERHQPYFCRLGAGRVDWPAWARLYRDHGLSDWAILELDAAADPIGEITASRQFVETALMPIIH